jgi:hypothetical protein
LIASSQAQEMRLRTADSRQTLRRPGIEAGSARNPRELTPSSCKHSDFKRQPLGFNEVTQFGCDELHSSYSPASTRAHLQM